VFADGGNVAAEALADGLGVDAFLRPRFDLTKFVGGESFSTGHVDSTRASYGMKRLRGGERVRERTNSTKRYFILKTEPVLADFPAARGRGRGESKGTSRILGEITERKH